MLIHPKDSVDLDVENITHNIESITCPPIVLLDSEELLTRESARTRLGLSPDVTVVYVQLGAGEINDIESDVRLTLEALLENPDVYVVLGESLLGDRIDIDLPRIRIIRDYPNSIYFRGFDATVQAGGYNSFHETRKFGLPALFYPNMNTGMDNQLARCKVAEEEGWGIVLETRSVKKIRKSCIKLLGMIGREYMSNDENGARNLAIQLLSKELTP